MQAEWSSVDEQSVVRIHGMGLFSALHMNEILPRAVMWMNLEDIVLSEVSQLRKNKCCMISLT